MRHIKHFLAILLVLCSTVASAHDFEAGGIYYNITDATAQTVEVTYLSYSYDAVTNEYTGAVIIPSTVTYNGTTYSVTSIGDYAFRSCTGLTSVTIGNGVTSIGGYAFEDCSGLTAVHINDLAAWCRIDFRGSSSNPLSYAHNLYLNGKKVTNLVFPSDITEIKKYAFRGCSGLTSVTIPNGVTGIGYSAFYYCTGLTSVTIGNSVTSIGEDAFQFCTGLTSVTIGNSVTSIGEGAFYGCSGLKTVYNLSSLPLEKGSTYYGYVAFYADYLINAPNGSFEGDFIFGVVDGVSTLVVYIGNGGDITLPTNYKGYNYVIGSYAFEGCTGLTGITIPNGVTGIGDNAFYGCTGLTGVTIPNSVTRIGGLAFEYCSGLTSVTIGNSVTRIGYSAFYGCSGLKTVYNLSSLPLEKGSTDYGYVAFYADYLINTPNGSVEGDFIFGVVDGVNTLCGYVGNGGDITLPTNYKGYNYVIGSYAFRGCSGLTGVTIPNGVTGIGDYAFYGCTGLTGIEIPNSVTSIGSNAFQGCSGLIKVTIGNSVTSIGNHAFHGCSDLRSVVIPSSVTSIGSNAFYGCDGLTSVTIGNSVTSIGSNAFYGCTGLTSVTIGNSVTSIGSYAFAYCTGLRSVVIPSSVTSIGGSAFYGCSGLKSVYNNSSLNIFKGREDYGYVAYYADRVINHPYFSVEGNFIFGVIDDVIILLEYIGNGGDITLPTNYKGYNYVIGSYAFSNCTGLTGVTIPNGVTGIGDNAFYGCTGLTGIEIPNSVTSIGSNVFYGCTGLTGIEIPNSVTSIGDNAFYGCTGLTGIEIPNSVTSIGGSAFYGCTGLTGIEIPNSVTSIGGSAFSGCTRLVSVTINSESIGEGMFSGCTKLADVTIGNNVTSIGGSAFYGCSGLTSVTIGNSVESIGESAFYGCTGLTSVTIGNSVTGIGDNAFYGCTGLKTVYNLSSLPLGWGNYSDYGHVSYYANYLINAPNGSFEGDFIFGVVDGVNTLVAYIGNGGDITLPADYNGENYVIGSSVFSRCTGLTSIVIPNSVTSIGRSAFYGCSGLTSVTIGNSVTSIGSNAFDGCTGLTAVHINDLAAWCRIDFSSIFSNPLYYVHNLYLNGEKVTDLVIPDGVTSIGDYAFYYCTGLTGITIPNSVTSIGVDAFWGCNGLTAVHINDLSAWCKIDFWNYFSNPLYYVHNLYLNGEKVTDLVIPNSVTSIGDYAFYGCRGLTSIVIPNSVTSIGKSAFEGCSGLTSIIIPNSVESIGNEAFDGCSGLIKVTIGNSVTGIGDNAFRDCGGLKIVCNLSSLPLEKGSNNYGLVAYYADVVFNNISIEGDFLFTVVDGVNTLIEYTGNGGDITLPADYNGENYVIAANAFRGRSGLTSIEIPNSVTSIGDHAFQGCSGLTGVTIGNSVTSIGSYAFNGCSSLTSVHISDLSAWCKIDFNDYYSNPLYYATNLYLNGEQVTDLVIPSDITEIKQYAFYGCTGLTGIEIPSSVTSIGGSAFYGCTGLTSVTIGNSVESIGGSAFSGCTGLTGIEIPSSVTSIGASAFSDCTDLVSVTINSESIGESMFSGCTKLADVTIGNNATSIGRSAFSDCTGLTGVTIPNSVTSIGYGAFYYCTGLTSVTIGNSVTSIGNNAFYYCDGLTDITIGNSVTSIGGSAFYRCFNLKTVYNFSSLPLVKGSTDYGYVAFYADYLINTPNGFVEGDFIFDVVDGVNTLCGYVGNGGDITLPADYNGENYVIAANAFYGCTGLTGIVISSGVTSIGSYAFYGCTGLANVFIQSGVNYIGINAFYNCTNLKIVYNSSSLNIVKGSEDFGYVAYYANVVFNNISIEGDFVFARTKEPPLQFTTADGLPGTVTGSNHIWESPVINSSTNGVRITVLATNGGSNMYNYNGYPIVALGELEFYDGNGNKINYTASNVTTNSLEGSEGSLDALCDGSYSTFYHSTWSGNGTTPTDYVYLDVKFPKTVDAFKIKMVGRNTKSLVPTEIRVTRTGSSTEALYNVWSLVDYIGDDTALVLPENYNSESYAIGADVFKDNTTITSVTISSGVTGIGDRAFYGCENLKTVYNHSSLNIVLGSTDNGYAAYYADKVINADGSSNGVIGDYKFTSANGVNTLVEYLGDGGNITLPENYNGENYVIGDSVFYDCTGLTGVTIPNSVTSIGSYAFSDCTRLTSVTIPNSVTSIGWCAFYKCSGLTSVTIGNSVESIGESAFYGCRGLTSVHISDLSAWCKIDFNDYYSNPLYYATNLYLNGEQVTDLVIPSDITEIKNYTFYGCSGLTSVTIGNSVTSIGGSAFYGCSGLTSVTIGSGVTSIGFDAFYKCSGLVSVTINSESIGEGMFSGCTKLADVTIGNNVSSIGNYAFNGCDGLTDITIGNSVTSIGGSAFYRCFNLKTVYNFSSLPLVKGSTDYGYVAYYADKVINAPNGSIEGDFVFGIKDGVNTLVEYIGDGGDITLPENYNGENYVIGADVFQDNTAITGVTIPAGVTAIGDNAFYGCENLKTVTNNSSLNIVAGSTDNGYAAYYADKVINADGSSNGVIGDYKFTSYNGVNTLVEYIGDGGDITLPENYNGENYVIGADVFQDNTAITGVTIPAGVTAIGDNAFYGCSGLKIVINKSSLNIVKGSIDNGYVAYYADKVITINADDSSTSIIGYYKFTSANGVNTLVEYLGDGGDITLPENCNGENYVIGSMVFLDNTAITSVTIPAGVTAIGDNAFFGCENLKTVTNNSSLNIVKGSIDNGYVAYYADNVITINADGSSNGVIGDYKFTSANGVNTLVEYLGDGGDITLPENCNGENYVIGSMVFLDNTAITSVTIPTGVTAIGDNAFYGCENLKTVTNNSSLNIVKGSIDNGYVAYYADKVINADGSSTSIIGDYKFTSANGVNTLVEYLGDGGDITLPENYNGENYVIGSSAFEDCTSLTSIEIPNSVTSIGNYAFNGCSGLTSVTIGNSVTSIGYGAFEDCTGLTSVTIPNSVTSIGDNAFSGCYGLTSVTIGNSVTSIGFYAFVWCTGLTGIEIPNSVTSIGDYAFYGCENLKTVTNNSSLNIVKGSIDNGYVAYYADYLINTPNGSVGGDFIFDVVDGVNTLIEYTGNGGDITLPADYNGENYVIAANAFRGYSGLTSIEIPNSVTSIGNHAFHDCSGLTSVTIGNSVTSIGFYAFYGCSGLTSVHINDLAAWCRIDFGSDDYSNPLYYARNLYLNGEQVTDLVIPSDITEIKNYTFYGCWGLTGIEIPNSVTSIGDYAFYGCENLKTVTNNSSLNIVLGSTDNGYVAYYADYLINTPNGSVGGDFIFGVVDGVNTLIEYTGNGGDITLPADYNGENYVIAANAFRGCSGLTSIEIPNSVTSIGERAFYDCDGLTGVTIPNSVTSIGRYAFAYCSGLTAVHINDLAAWCRIDFGSDYYSNPLFYAHNLYLNGEKVTNLVIPSDITEIKQYAFDYCTGLTSVTIGNSVTSIGDDAFYCCTGLTSVTIGNSVTSIGGSVFYGCTDLTSITVNSGNSIYDSREGCNAIIETATNTLIAGCKNTIIPNSVTSIGERAFYNCDGLTSVTIPNSVTSIGERAFYDCEGLTSIEISNSVTSIGEGAFSWCSGLTSVTIGNSVTSIGGSAFVWCSGLTEIYSLAETPATITYNTFNNYSATLYVPAGAKEAYQAADYWKNFTNIVETLPGDINGDSEVNVGDFASLVNLIFNSDNIDAATMAVADINGDGEVNVGDFAGLVNLIFNSGSQAAPKRAAALAATVEPSLYIEPFSIAPGEQKQIAVLLDNPGEKFSQLQFDLALPEGVEIVFDEDNFCYTIDRGSRLASVYNIDAQDVNGGVKVLALTTNPKAYIKGESGDVLLITVQAADDIADGVYDLSIDNVVLSHQDGSTVKASSTTAAITVSSTTGLTNIEGAEGSDVYYDLQGRAVKEPSNGFYIVNGKKVFIK